MSNPAPLPNESELKPETNTKSNEKGLDVGALISNIISLRRRFGFRWIICFLFGALWFVFGFSAYINASSAGKTTRTHLINANNAILDYKNENGQITVTEYEMMKRLNTESMAARELGFGDGSAERMDKVYEQQDRESGAILMWLGVIFMLPAAFFARRKSRKVQVASDLGPTKEENKVPRLIITPTSIKESVQPRKIGELASIFQNSINQAQAAMKEHRSRMEAAQAGRGQDAKKDTVESKLASLKSALDKGLITQDDYDAKKRDLIDKL